MADDADRANKHSQDALDRAIAAARGIVSDKKSLDCCIECGLGISSARQIAIPGVETCIECAERNEKKRRFFR